MSAKRKQITEAALKLFCEKGFQYTSTASIAQEAGVATGTLFLYFSTKEELINTLYKEAKYELTHYLQEAIPGDADTKNKLGHIWTKAHEWALANYTAFRFIHMFASSPFITRITRDEVASTADFAEHFIKQAIQEGVLMPIDTPLFFLLFDGIWTATVNYLSSSADNTNHTLVIEQTFEVFWKGVAL